MSNNSRIKLIWVYFQLASAQNCSIADYSNITTIANALAASLNGTRSLVNLIPNVYMYSGYSDFWDDMGGMNLNMLGNNFAYMDGNATASLVAVFRNFSLVAANTSATSNQSLANLQQLIGETFISLIPLSSGKFSCFSIEPSLKLLII